VREKTGHFLPVFYVPIQLCIAFLFLFRNLLASGKDVREKVIKKVILLSRGAGKNGHFVPFFFCTDSVVYGVSGYFEDRCGKKLRCGKKPEHI
jgi:hypothetical protein